MSNTNPVFQQRFDLLLNSGLASHASITAAWQVLNMVEDYYGIQLSEELGAPLATHLAVTGKRLQQREQLLPAGEHVWSELRGYQSEVELAARMVSELKQQLGIEIVRDEVGYIALHLVRIVCEATQLPPQEPK